MDTQTISPQSHRVMRVYTAEKWMWDEKRPTALKKAKDSFIYPMIDDDEDRNDPDLYMVMFRYRGKYYTGHWEHTLDEFDGITITGGVRETTEVYYVKPQVQTQEAA